MVRWLVLTTLLAALGTTSPAAAIDLSGDYVVAVPIPCRLTDVQTGTLLQVSVSCSIGSTGTLAGTVDPDTGAFSITGAIPGLCADLACTGMGDGEETRSTCTSSTPVCNVSLFGTKCGNGVLDPLETCEDGNAAGGNCCSARCQLDPAGTTCTSDGNGCTDDVCDATGTCMHVPNTGPCDDGNACTLGDVCAGGACVPGSTPAPATQACTTDFDPCTDDVCDATGTCTHVPVSPAECRSRTPCHSTCTEQLKQCRQTCPGVGPARRACRAACAERSTCTAPGAPIRTLAYVENECTTDPKGRSSLKQTLLVRRGNCDPVRVRELGPSIQTLDGPPLCRVYGESRTGRAARLFGAFQRLAVLPDGSGVVFEVTRGFSEFPAITPGAPSDEGMFFVRSDGSGLRPLGPPSRRPLFQTVRDPNSPIGLSISFTTDTFAVSPDGRKIAMIDLGPIDPNAPERGEAPQVVLLDVRSGHRRQLTYQSRPFGSPSDPTDAGICCQNFLDRHTVIYFTPLDSHGFKVRTDGSHEKAIPFLSLNAPGILIPRFGIAGARQHSLFVAMPRPAVNGGTETEEWLLDGGKPLQLTTFNRSDTGLFGSFLHRGRVFFPASGSEPAGANPDGICQLFSIDTFGGGLRQLTHLPSDGGTSYGCRGSVSNFQFPTPPRSACGISWGSVSLDPITGTMLFQSSCDPVGGAPFGEQIFGMRPDGTGLRQLTNARGVVTDPDGTIHVELYGPVAAFEPSD